jgi:hypothetical protein
MLGEKAITVVVDVTQDIGDGYHLFIPAFPRHDGDVNLDDSSPTYGFNPPEGYQFYGVIHRLGKDQAQKWIDENPDEYQRLVRGEKLNTYLQ